MPKALTRRTSDPLGVQIYHICHVDNLPSILECGEICPLNILRARGVAPRSIAYSHLQARRDAVQVPIAPGGDLHDYSPWSFAARSPMLYTAARGALTNSASQNDIVHLVSDVERIQNLKLPFVFTDGHPLTTAFTRFSDDLNQLIAFLDWDVLLDPWWNKTPDDSDRTRRRQAEFLIHGAVSWALVRGIAVATGETQRRVEQILDPYAHQPPVRVLPDWYY